MPSLLFFMKDCYVLVKEEWVSMNSSDVEQVGCELWSFFFFLGKNPTKHKTHKTSLKTKVIFFIGEF